MIQLVEEVKKELTELAEPEYQAFHSKLLPGIDSIMGVRVPALRKLAQKIAKKDWRAYLDAECFTTYEETMLHGMVIGYAKMDDEERRKRLDVFVPHINNWAVCDCCTSTYKFMKKDQRLWADYLMQQIQMGTEYRIRFSVVALMDYYVSDEWIDFVLDTYEDICHEGYYVKMAVAWGVSVCYVKYPQKTMRLFQENKLDTFTNNKAIQKIRESFRVSPKEKDELKKWKKEQPKRWQISFSHQGAYKIENGENQCQK